MTPLEELIRLVEEVSGVVVPERDRGPLERVALEQARQSGHDELRPYVSRLRSHRDGPEWQALLTRITVKESYLFRAPQQLRALADDLLPRLLANRPADRTLRVWSAGCARGEEPTTLAMVLADSPHMAGRGWKILATDVDESALRDARRAVFGPRAVAFVPPPLLERHMVAGMGGSYALADRLRARVEHRTLNLVSRPLPLPEAPFDLVFLRNVLIYFRPEQQQRVVQSVVEVLAPDGYLFLGPAESLWQLGTGLVPVELGDCFCFRRPAHPNPRQEPVAVPAEPRLDRLSAADGPHHEIAARPRREAPLHPTGPALETAIVEALGRGQSEAADVLIREAIRVSPDNARLRAFQGLAAEAAGDQRAAVRCYRAALYLDPRLSQVRFLLGRCLDRAGLREQARRAYRHVLATTGHGEPAVEVPEGEKVGIPSTSHVVAECRRALEGGPAGRQS